jgi:mRNA interferase YafQ
MLEPILTNLFKKELKLMKRRRMNMAELKAVMESIADEQPLPERCRPHVLHGKKWEGKWECHVQADWILVYHIDQAKQKVVFHRTGSHSDLFK